jgi:MFS family permease
MPFYLFKIIILRVTSLVSPGRKTRYSGTFRALRHPNYRLWFVGQTISLIGSWMQTMAQQVLVYRLTGSAAALGIVNFVALIPLIPFSLWGGSIVDRLPKRNVLIAVQWVLLIQAVVLGVLAWTGTVQVWHVYLLSFFLGAANAVDLPARQAFTVDMVEGKEDLTNAIGLNSAMFNGARAVGPALAGIVVAAVGEGPAFLLNAASFLAVIFSLLAMKNLPAPARPDPAARGLGHMVEGARYVSGQPTILLLMTLVAVSALLSMPYGTLLPVFAGTILADSARPVVSFFCDGPGALIACRTPEALPLGMLLAAVGLGAVVGALTVASLPDGARRGRWLTLGNIGFPLVLFFAAVSRSFPLTLLLMSLVGLLFVWQNALANTLIQMSAPDAVRGRVMALYSMVTIAFMRLGSLQSGYLADWIGAPMALGLGAALSLVFGLWVFLFKPKIRRL